MKGNSSLRWSWIVATLASLVVGASAAAQVPPQRIVRVPSVIGPDFCSDIQRILAGTRLVSRNTLHATFDSFVKSKPQVRPLETHQYVEYADSAHTRPMQVACKTKSADHLQEVYGPGSALDDNYSCRAINRSIVLDAWGAMSAAERAAARWPPSRIMLDGDDGGFMGAQFIKPYTFLYQGADGLPHVQAKSQYASWTDWRWKFMPDRFKGTHYCRLIAPEYASSLIRGEVRLAPKPAEQ
jgi:hypothetical protein